MSDPERDQSSETEAAGMTERPEAYHAVNGQPEKPDAAAPMESCAPGASPRNESAEGGGVEGQSGGARLVFRDGVAYVEGCDVPVWRLEMGRRAGSSASRDDRSLPQPDARGTRPGVRLCPGASVRNSTR